MIDHDTARALEAQANCLVYSRAENPRSTCSGNGINVCTIRDRSRKLALEVFSVLSVFEDVLALKRVDIPRTKELISEIEELLLEKGIKPGVRLGSKEELGRCFRVSPGTLNEALRVLETRGILELRRGSKGGVFAAAVSMQPSLD